MLDLLNLPPSTGSTDVQMFTSLATVTGIQWQTWRKPRGKTMCHIICIGGGGGGGGGFIRASGNGGGGGGGGSSGYSRVTIPCFLLPDILYIQVGAGGQGQVSGGGAAGSGLLSYVSIFHGGGSATVASNTIALSGAALAVGGGTGTVAAAGGAGTAATIPTIGAMPLAGLGQFALIAGQAGIIGGAVDTAGGAQSIPTTSCLCQGGWSGAGVNATDRAGGTCATISGSLISESVPAGPAAGSYDGSTGPMLWKPFFSFGGGGGSSSNANVGGAGGNGAYGSGGGGGGSGVSGGRGGDGGGGLVIIICW